MSAVGRKPFIRQPLAAVTAKVPRKAGPSAIAEEGSQEFSPSVSIESPPTPVAIREALFTKDLSGHLGRLARDGSALGDSEPQSELEEEREVEDLVSPIKLTTFEMPFSASLSSNTECPGYHSMDEGAVSEGSIIAILLQQMIEEQRQARLDAKDAHLEMAHLNRNIASRQEDLMNFMKNDVMELLECSVERCSRSRGSTARTSSTDCQYRRNRLYHMNSLSPVREPKGKEPLREPKLVSVPLETDISRHGVEETSPAHLTICIDDLNECLARYANKEDIEVLTVLKHSEFLRGITLGLLSYERYR